MAKKMCIILGILMIGFLLVMPALAAKDVQQPSTKAQVAGVAQFEMKPEWVGKTEVYGPTVKVGKETYESKIFFTYPETMKPTGVANEAQVSIGNPDGDGYSDAYNLITDSAGHVVHWGTKGPRTYYINPGGVDQWYDVPLSAITTPIIDSVEVWDLAADTDRYDYDRLLVQEGWRYWYGAGSQTINNDIWADFFIDNPALTTTGTPIQDGKNVIGFTSSTDTFIAVCWVWWNAGTHEVTEFDVAWNWYWYDLGVDIDEEGTTYIVEHKHPQPSGAWDVFDFQNVMTHEMGHAVCLDHTPSYPGMTMYNWIGISGDFSTETHKTSLEPGDVYGVWAMGFYDLWSLPDISSSIQGLETKGK